MQDEREYIKVGSGQEASGSVDLMDQFANQKINYNETEENEQNSNPVQDPDYAEIRIGAQGGDEMKSAQPNIPSLRTDESRATPMGNAGQILNVNGNQMAQRNMRGRIYAANDVLNGVGGNEQLANALKVKGPSYGGVNYSPKPLPDKLNVAVPRSGGGQIKSTYSRS